MEEVKGFFIRIEKFTIDPKIILINNNWNTKEDYKDQYYLTQLKMIKFYLNSYSMLKVKTILIQAIISDKWIKTSINN